MSNLDRLRVPVFKAGGMPDLDTQKYRLHVAGFVKKQRIFTWTEIKEFPRSAVNARLTSVSGWSVRATWEGILWRDFVGVVRPTKRATHATFSSVGGTYETTVALVDLDHPRVLLVYAVDGEPLEGEYGGPLRMVIPNLYGYKSCKWLETITLSDSMKGGYWEDRGYTRSGIIEQGTTLDLNTGRRRPIPGGEVTEF
ncbi:MAG: molybdopterin-dependent oxidoreductase [Proteobacteria bacterium]|nr:molybdopterin-dependent oxidoreductase [Pseudomonadota bacterium]